MTPTLEELGLDKLSAWQKRSLAEALLASADKPEDEATRAARLARLDAAYERLIASGDRSIPDPAAWQREVRAERDLPGRES